MGRAGARNAGRWRKKDRLKRWWVDKEKWEREERERVRERGKE